MTLIFFFFFWLPLSCHWTLGPFCKSLREKEKNETENLMSTENSAFKYHMLWLCYYCLEGCPFPDNIYTYIYLYLPQPLKSFRINIIFPSLGMFSFESGIWVLALVY